MADKSVQASREVREILKGEQAERDIRFTYGEKERRLMQHLGEHNSITVDLFASIAGVSRRIASRTLVLLVLANVLMIHPSDVMDQYTTRPCKGIGYMHRTAYFVRFSHEPSQTARL